jgi:hypothetical protein
MVLSIFIACRFNVVQAGSPEEEACRFTTPNWCRNINRNANSELRRNYIQIKWFSIVSDLQKIRNKEFKILELL